MRHTLKRWKRKGGEGGTPGNYDELFEKLNGGSEDNDLTESLRKLLEGDEYDDITEFTC